MANRIEVNQADWWSHSGGADPALAGRDHIHYNARKFKLTNLRFIPLFLVTLSGCEEATGFYLYRADTTVPEASRDYFECEVASAQNVPTDTRVETTPIYTTPIQTNCYPSGYSVQCYTTGGQVYGGNTYTYDANAELRGKFMGRCLVGKGYSGYELPRCKEDSISEEILTTLRSGRLNPPRTNACYVPINDVGNVAYISTE